jgi:hypothetical protein
MQQTIPDAGCPDHRLVLYWNYCHVEKMRWPAYGTPLLARLAQGARLRLARDRR